MTTALYLVASTILLVLFGAGPARALAPGTGFAGTAGIAYGIGALLVTLEALVYSAIGVRWSIARLSAPLLILSAFLAWRAERKARKAGSGAPIPGPSVWAAGVAALAAAVFAVSLANSSANSVDFVLIYGVKAVLFAKERAISAAVLGHPLFSHAAPRYPPLMPMVESWGTLVAGELPWRFGAAISFAWYAASIAAIGSRLRRRVGADLGAAVAAYWASAFALSFGFSYSAGNGEAPLVFFISTAGAFLLTEEPGESRWLPAVLLAGGALSKQEGLLAALGLALGTVLRDVLQKRPRALTRGALVAALPLAAVLVWFGYERLVGLPVGYRPPGPVLRMDFRLLPAIVPDLLRNLDAGTWGLVWALPIVVLVRGAKAKANAKRLVSILPAVVASAAIAAALLATYVSPVSIGRADVITRTLPRACQPVLSLLILGAAICVGRRHDERDTAGAGASASARAVG